jgi:hypothetical protein
VEIVMSMACRTCEHPRRSDIDIAIARGGNCAELARQFGVSTRSVQRHKAWGHVPPSIINAFPRHRANLSREALAQLRADESAGVLLHLATQRTALLRVQDRAERAGNETVVMQAARELHRNIELTGRTLGTFAEHERAITQVANLGILMSPEYVDLRASLIKALAPHPAARQAVGAVLAAVEGHVPQFPGRPRQVIDVQRADQ